MCQQWEGLQDIYRSLQCICGFAVSSPVAEAPDISTVVPEERWEADAIVPGVDVIQ